MEGLEITIIPKSTVFTPDKRRLNSEYYLKKIVSFREKGGNRLEEYLTYNKRGMQPIYSNTGSIRALRSVNIREMGITDDRDVYVDEEFYIGNKRGVVTQGDVLLTSTGVGTLGRAGIALDSQQYFVDGHITILRTTNALKNTTLFLFLNSSYGQLQINALYNGSSGQIEIYPEDINEILIPEFTAKFQEALEELVVNSDKKIKTSNFKNAQAEHILMDGLGFESFTNTGQAVNIKTFKESFLDSGRLDAEYYQPKFDQLKDHLLKTGSAIQLGSCLINNKRGTQPTYTESVEGIPVLNSKHIRENRIEFTDNRLASHDKVKSDTIIRRNDVLINGTGVGTIGRSAVYLKDEPALPDNHVTILRTDTIDPVFLSVQLNSIIGKLQVEKYFKGSSGQIELYPADIDEFTIWNAPHPIQKKIRETIEEADNLRIESETLLKLAKQAIEIAIEEGEENAIALINQLKP